MNELLTRKEALQRFGIPSSTWAHKLNNGRIVPEQDGRFDAAAIAKAFGKSLEEEAAKIPSQIQQPKQAAEELFSPPPPASSWQMLDPRGGDVEAYQLGADELGRTAFVILRDAPASVQVLFQFWKQPPVFGQSHTFQFQDLEAAKAAIADFQEFAATWLERDPRSGALELQLLAKAVAKHNATWITSF